MVGSAPPFHRLDQCPSIAACGARSPAAAQALAFASSPVPASLAPAANSVTSRPFGSGTSMTSNGFRISASYGFIGDLQLVPSSLVPTAHTTLLVQTWSVAPLIATRFLFGFRLRRPPHLVGEGAIGQRLGEVHAADLLRVVEVGERARDPQHAVIAARGQPHGVGGVAQQR